MEAFYAEERCLLTPIMIGGLSTMYGMLCPSNAFSIVGYLRIVCVHREYHLVGEVAIDWLDLGYFHDKIKYRDLIGKMLIQRD